MTCIVGLEHKGRVYMGADSMASNGFTKFTIAREKVFRNGDFLIGSCGSVRMSQLLMFALDAPKLPEDPRDHYAFMVTDFVGAVKDTFQHGGFGYHFEDRPHEGGTFMVGTRAGGLYQIYGDYQVSRREDGFYTCGSGTYHAEASLYTSAETMKDPKRRVLLALETAAAFTTSVGGPFMVESI